jgi:phosphoglucosamine mutase
MTRNYFGTDGIRGTVGQAPITADFVLRLAHAVGRVLRKTESRPTVLIGKDTRISGYMLESALESGFNSAGVDVVLLGPLPTPGVAYLTRAQRASLGVVISASHNPYQDNGIKFFGPEGTKLDDAQEAEIERLLGEPAAQRLGRVRELHGAPADYLRELEARFADLRLDGVKVLLDCANGATHRVAPEIFRRLGAHVDAVAVEPDGRNINENCGSTHVEGLAAHLDGHDLGFAFDGDGDRVLAIDRNGSVIDGDGLLALAALHLREHDRLPGNGVAVTVMTNYGFHQAMREHGVEVATTDVGDRNVLGELLQRGWALGGEQSGHIIDTGFVPAGDGTAAALLVLEALAGSDLAERHAMEKLPQRLVNVRVPDPRGLDDSEEVWAAVNSASKRLEGRGRVLVRSSGTEPLIRIMVEAPQEEECEEIVQSLAKTVESCLR